jgi:hypothetical protein
MSEGFPADWLALREPYDGAARSERLVDALAAWAAGRQDLEVADLGAGTGSTLRRLAPRLGGARWTLVELDPALQAAGEALLAGSAGDGVAWRYLRLDLASGLERLADVAPRLITASALLDLVSEDWMGRLAALVGRTGAAFYAALTIDGRLAWRPQDPDDDAVLRLVAAHQRTGKGFGGEALGPTAVAALRRAFADLPGELLIEPADWRLGPADHGIQAALLEGYVASAAAMSPADAAAVQAWGRRRAALIEAGGSELTVGHLDLLFLPAA